MWVTGSHGLCAAGSVSSQRAHLSDSGRREKSPHSARPTLPLACVKQSFIFVTLIPTRSLNKRRRTVVAAAGDSLKLSAPTLQEIKVDKERLEGVCLRARGRNVEHNAPKWGDKRGIVLICVQKPKTKDESWWCNALRQKNFLKSTTWAKKQFVHCLWLFRREKLAQKHNSVRKFDMIWMCLCGIKAVGSPAARQNSNNPKISHYMAAWNAIKRAPFSWRK